jgi:hypothetical protein
MELGPHVLAAITGAGGALVVLAIGCWLFIAGRVVPRATLRSAIADKDKQLAEKDREIAEWKAAYTVERTRSDTAVLAAQGNYQVLAALHKEVASP